MNHPVSKEVLELGIKQSRNVMLSLVGKSDCALGYGPAIAL